ncbi:MAG: acyl-CoA carboxylase subunit beta, partial [Candidatus Nanopelagicaceae bacterium]
MPDSKDPELRISKLLDGGTFQLITERDKSGMLAASGKVKGNDVIVFASDPTVQGGALGPEGAAVIVKAYEV